jgi:HEAT repeat protein
LIETGATEKKAALPVLLDGLNDAATPTRLEAAEFLVRLGPVERQAVLPVLLDLLNERTARQRASQLLDQFNPEQMKSAQPALAGMLQDPDGTVRLQGAKLLGRLGPAEAKTTIPVLIELLKDPQEFTRIQAVDQLGRIGPDAKEAMPALIARLKEKGLVTNVPHALARMGSEALPALLETLNSDNAALRNSTVVALGTLGPAAQTAIPKLIELVTVAKGTQRSGVMTALERMGDVSLPFLIKALEKEEGRRAVIETLGRFGPRGKAAIPALVKLLQDPDPGVRALAALSLRPIRMDFTSPDLTPALLAGLKDPDPELRRRVVLVFSGNTPKSPEVINALRQAVKDTDDQVRIGAAGILCTVPGEAKTLVPVLREALSDIRYRKSALAGLTQAGPAAKEAMPALIAALKNPSDVQFAAQAAMTLSFVGGNDAVAPLLQALPTAHPQLRPKLVHAMDLSGTVQVSPFLELTKHGDAEVRMASIQALGRRAGLASEVVPALTVALNDLDPRVRAMAVQAIDKQGPAAKAAEQPLVALLKDPVAYVRTDAALALISIGKSPADVMPALLPVLQTPNHAARGRVLANLGNLGPEAAAAVPGLMQMLAEPGYARWKASEVLGRIGKPAKAAVPNLAGLLSEKELLTRLLAAVALWQVEGKADPIVGVLIEAVKNPSLGQAQALISPPSSALSGQRSDGIGYSMNIRPGQVWPSVNIAEVRRQGVGILGEIGPEARAAVPVLKAAMKDKLHPERLPAALSLWRIERSTAEVVPLLIEALKDKTNAMDRRLAVTIVGQIGPDAKAAIPALIEVLRDADMQLREQVTQALTKVSAEPPKKTP